MSRALRATRDASEGPFDLPSAAPRGFFLFAPLGFARDLDPVRMGASSSSSSSRSSSSDSLGISSGSSLVSPRLNETFSAPPPDPASPRFILSFSPPSISATVSGGSFFARFASASTGSCFTPAAASSPSRLRFIVTFMRGGIADAAPRAGEWLSPRESMAQNVFFTGREFL